MTYRDKGAVISDDELYRYFLWREWAEGPRVLFVMLNPSTADGLEDDATIRRCVSFARAWGFGRLDVMNLFAFRATDPRAMKAAVDPVGPENDAWLQTGGLAADKVVLAYGAHGAHRDRGRLVFRRLERPCYCLGRTNAGDPRHPLYLPSSTPLELVA